MSVRCLFIVQGEGRGHLTQAMALRRILTDAGHQVAEVVVGRSPSRAVPSFFSEAFEAPVTLVDSPSFVPGRDDQSVRPWATLLRELGRAPSFINSLSTIDAAAKRHDPDVLVNFFEPLGGLYAAHYRPEIPVVAVGHQYMFQHPTYSFPSGWPVQRWATRTFASVTAWGATRRLALSLYPAPDRPSDGIAVLPPLLRPALFRQPTDRSAPFFLAYILNSGYADDIIQWHHQAPDVRLHCFWDRPDAAPVEHYDDTLTFHQLDDDKFLRLMARCRGVVSTAGFESVAEAMYLGKPVQVVPVDGHFEQLCNAVDTVRARAGIRSDRFDLDRLRAFVPRHTPNTARFRHWVQNARSRFAREIEAVGNGQAAAPTPAPPTSDAPALKTAW